MIQVKDSVVEKFKTGIGFKTTTKVFNISKSLSNEPFENAKSVQQLKPYQYLSKRNVN